MPPGTGFRIFPRHAGLSTELLRSFGELTVPNIADAMHGIGVVDAGIRPVNPLNARVVGRALTITITPGDGLMIRAAIPLAGDGDVMVVNGAGETQRAVLGGNVLMTMATSGISALIVDGAIRDPEEAKALGFPVFARGVTPRSGLSAAGRGEINGPAACGGVVVFSGDLVVGDQDGVVVVPSADAEFVLEAASDIQRTKGGNHDLHDRIARAKRSGPAGADSLSRELSAVGCVSFDDPWRLAGNSDLGATPRP